MSISTNGPRKSLAKTDRMSSRLPRPILDASARLSKFLTGNRVTPSKTSRKVGNSVFKSIAERACEIDEPLPDIEYLVYYGDGKSDSHFRMWDPVFKRADKKYASVFRSAGAWYRSTPADNCFPLNKISQVEPFLDRLPNLKAIFYPANNGTNLQMVRNGEYTHVFLGHGDSGKSSSAHKGFRLYDEVWVAGDAHIDRFDRVPGNYCSIEFRKIGQPWLSEFLVALEAAREKRKLAHEKPRNIGYFPTWSGYYTYANFSSILQMDWITEELSAFQPESFDKLYTKLHPWTSDSDKASFKKVSKNCKWIENFDPEAPLHEAFLKDISLCICDNSSSITESLYLDVPILVYLAPEAEYEPDFQEVLNFCYFFSNAEELRAHLTNIFDKNQDPLAKTRKEKLNYIVDLEAMRNDQFGKELERLSAS